MTKTQIKWLGMALAFGAAIALLYPTADWYTLDSAERAQREAERRRPKWLLNLGLDLRGGTHLLMELDISKLEPKADVADAVQRAIEIIRNRVDQFGVAEPLIAKQGDRWIVVQLPGVSNSEQAKELVGKTAQLEFRMVESGDVGQKALGKIAELPAGAFVGSQISTAAAKLVPEGMELLRGKESSLYLVSKTAPLSGRDLETARVETGGDYGMPVVAFTFKPEAASTFATLTAANVGKNMAIVLDGVVYSAPTIKGRIPGGKGINEGQFTIEDARALAIVLRAGALPAPVRVIEERTVGPSLGEDSIRAGFTASAVGIGMIFLFFALYYRGGGMIANLSIIANLLFLFAVMAYLGGTLTLPGIAGVSLNVAMAVDANILILERIKEEMAKGRPLRLAVASGYDLSASAILDSNLTLLAASALLFQFGTGPIKGFAVTLTAGNVISMFTATILTHMIYDVWLTRRDSDAAAA